MENRQVNIAESSIHRTIDYRTLLFYVLFCAVMISGISFTVAESYAAPPAPVVTVDADGNTTTVSLNMDGTITTTVNNIHGELISTDTGADIYGVFSNPLGTTTTGSSAGVTGGLGSDIGTFDGIASSVETTNPDGTITRVDTSHGGIVTTTVFQLDGSSEATTQNPDGTVTTATTDTSGATVVQTTGATGGTGASGDASLSNTAASCPSGTVDLVGPSGFSVFTFIIPCVRAQFEEISDALMVNFFSYIEGAYEAAIVLAVAIYGILLLMGLIEKAGRDTFVFVLKVGAVLWYVTSMDDILQLMLAIMDGMVDIVTQFSAFDTSDRCPASDAIWVRMDCTVDLIIGVGAPETLANGLLAFFFSSFISGAIGALIGIIGVLFTFYLFMGMLKAAFTYLMAVLGIIFLMMIGGMFVPLIFFTKATKGYFDKWVGMLAALVLQPIILFAYLNVALSALDVVIYSGDDSIYRAIAGQDADISEGFTINQHMMSNDVYKPDGGVSIVADLNQIAYETAQTTEDAEEGSGNMSEAMVIEECEAGVTDCVDGAAFGTSSENYQMRLALPEIDWVLLAEAREPPITGSDEKKNDEMLVSLLSAFLVAGLAAYVFLTLMDFIPTMAVDLAGGVHQAPMIGNVKMASGGAQDSVGGMFSNIGNNITSGAGKLLTGR